MNPSPHQQRMYEIALGERGQVEIPGPKSNLRILEYIKAVGGKLLEDSKYKWCGAFCAWCAMKAELPFRKTGLARAWIGWGTEIPIDEAQEGDIVVLWRDSPKGVKGHVGFFVRWQPGKKVELYGGNQANRTKNAVFEKMRILGVRRFTT